MSFIIKIAEWLDVAYISERERFSILSPELERLIHPVLGTAGQDRALPSHSAKDG